MQTPRVPERLAFEVHRRTRWSDEDTQGVLNNAVYLTLLEEARHAYFEKLGLLADNHFPFLLAQTNVKFLAPGRGGIEVVVEMATTRLGTRSLEQAYRIREAQGGKVLCEAEALLVTYDAELGRSVPMSDAFRAAMAGFEGL